MSSKMLRFSPCQQTTLTGIVIFFPLSFKRMVNVFCKCPEGKNNQALQAIRFLLQQLSSPIIVQGHSYTICRQGCLPVNVYQKQQQQQVLDTIWLTGQSRLTSYRTGQGSLNNCDHMHYLLNSSMYITHINYFIYRIS